MFLSVIVRLSLDYFTSYLDLRDSELSLTRARLTRFQAIYNFLVAQSELELLLGNAPIESYSAAIDSLN
jgi:outer membrane protein TolC